MTSKSSIGILHVLQVVVIEVHVHFKVGGLHHLGVPVVRSVENIVHGDPGVDQDWLTDYW